MHSIEFKPGLDCQSVKLAIFWDFWGFAKT